MKQIRILLADDHTVMRRGLRLLLESHPEFSVVAEASRAPLFPRSATCGELDRPPQAASPVIRQAVAPSAGMSRRAARWW